jgi:hypothetical protein
VFHNGSVTGSCHFRPSLNRGDFLGTRESSE